MFLSLSQHYVGVYGTMLSLICRLLSLLYVVLYGIHSLVFSSSITGSGKLSVIAVQAMVVYYNPAYNIPQQRFSADIFPDDFRCIKTFPYSCGATLQMCI